MYNECLTYQEQYELFFQPVCDLLERLNVKYIVHSRDDGEFRYLPDNKYCCCIEMINPLRSDCFFGLDLDDDVTLCYCNSHRHFDVCKNDNEEEALDLVLEWIEQITQNKLAGYLLFCGDDWVFGSTVKSEYIPYYEKTPWGMIYPGELSKNRRLELQQKGGRHSFTFWDPKYDKEVLIPSLA